MANYTFSQVYHNNVVITTQQEIDLTLPGFSFFRYTLVNNGLNSGSGYLYYHVVIWDGSYGTDIYYAPFIRVAKQSSVVIPVVAQRYAVILGMVGTSVSYNVFDAVDAWG